MSEELLEEKRFLLASLRDLDAEFAVGDIDEHDYSALRDGYISRVADVVHELEDGPFDEEVSVQPRKWLRRSVAVLCVLALAASSGVWVAQQAGQRLPGQSSSGGIEMSVANQLATARALNFSDPVTAIETYSAVLKLEPDNAEALTYRSWILALTARAATGAVKQLALATAVSDLIRAQQADPTYPDAYCFAGIVYFRFFSDAVLAKPQLDTCLAMNPPQEVKTFVDAIVKEVNAAIKK